MTGTTARVLATGVMAGAVAFLVLGQPASAAAPTRQRPCTTVAISFRDCAVDTTGVDYRTTPPPPRHPTKRHTRPHGR